MEQDRIVSEWLDKLGRRLGSLTEVDQRAAVFISELTALPPFEALEVFREVVHFGVTRRDRRSKLVLEAAMLSLARDQWPGDHRQDTLTAAREVDDALCVAFMDFESMSAAGSDEEPFFVPAYTADRPLTLGERRALAARPERRLLELAVRDPHPMVIAKLLDNPRLTESDVVAIASRRPAPSEVLREVGLHAKWRLRHRVALSLCLNPHTPPLVSVTLLLTLPVDDIRVIAVDERLSSHLRRAAAVVLGLE